MRYRYLDDFRRGISVFAIFSYGIAVLGTPQCPPRHEYDKYRPGSVSHTPSTTKTPGRPLYKKVKFYGRREHFVQWFCLLKCALLNVYQRFFYYVYVLWRVAGPGFYYSAGPRDHNRSYYGSWLGTSTCFQQKGFVYLPSKRKLFSGLL